MVAVGAILAPFALGGILACLTAAEGMPLRAIGDAKRILHSGLLGHRWLLLIFLLIVCHIRPLAAWLRLLRLLRLGVVLLHEGLQERLGKSRHGQLRLRGGRLQTQPGLLRRARGPVLLSWLPAAIAAWSGLLLLLFDELGVRGTFGQAGADRRGVWGAPSALEGWKTALHEPKDQLQVRQA